MAIFTPSALISEIRGSVGEQTFSRNKYSAYVKAKLNQTVTNTEFQLPYREAVADANAEYKTMSEAVFQEWRAFTQEQRKTNSLGVAYKRNVWNEFTSRFINRTVINAVTWPVSPYPAVRIHPFITSVEIAANTINVSWQMLTLHANSRIVVYASDVKSPGIRSVNPNWCSVVEVITPGSTSGTVNIYDAWSARFPQVSDPNGQRIFCAIKAVNADNYADGLKTFSSGIISGFPNPEFPFIFDDTFDHTFD